ncbi:hypothetical protein Q8A73_016801 [Channa argus]|nr:hypothetical protein Q8A73_016801 [Channa argus]
MNGTVVIMMVLSGLCFIPSCFLHLYYLLSDGKTWTEAQSYCRSKYTDLATVQNDQQLAELNQFIGSDYYSWIGLHSESETWRWSLENKNYYVGGEADFRMWTAGAPFLNQIYNKVCVLIRTSGKWEDADCSNTLPFICYNGTLNHSLSLIFVNEPKSWTEAQKYCRQHHTDLASVRNQAENDQMKLMIHNQTTWIGLYRDLWKWSDGSSYSVNNWYSGGAPSATATNICVVSYFGKWKNLDCNTKHDIACFLGLHYYGKLICWREETWTMCGSE